MKQLASLLLRQKAVQPDTAESRKVEQQGEIAELTASLAEQAESTTFDHLRHVQARRLWSRSQRTPSYEGLEFRAWSLGIRV